MAKKKSKLQKQVDKMSDNEMATVLANPDEYDIN